MKIRCPACGAEFSIEAALADEAGRELMGLLARMPAEVSRPLVAYLGLFRSAARSLTWDRALRLAKECAALDADPYRLGAALATTVEGLRAKREGAAAWKPLSNHNYLAKVLEGLPAGAGQALAVPTGPARGAPAGGKASATHTALAALQERINGG
jgi:hypothetical protein